MWQGRCKTEGWIGGWRSARGRASQWPSRSSSRSAASGSEPGASPRLSTCAREPTTRWSNAAFRRSRPSAAATGTTAGSASRPEGRRARGTTAPTTPSSIAWQSERRFPSSSIPSIRPRSTPRSTWSGGRTPDSGSSPSWGWCSARAACTGSRGCLWPRGSCCARCARARTRRSPQLPQVTRESARC